MLNISKILFICVTTFVLTSRGFDYDHHDDDDHEFDHSDEDDHHDFGYGGGHEDHPEDSREMRAVPTVPPPTQDVSGNPCACVVTAFVPQCGSDGRTYADECRFKCAQQKDPNLKLTKKGQCTQAG